jgi:chromosome segregation ATPase
MSTDSNEEDSDVGLSYRARNIDEAGGFFTNDENGGREYDMDDDNRGDGYGRAANNSADFEDGGLNAEEDILLSVPSFANAENKALNERLIQQNALLARETAETAEHNNRISIMTEHLNSLKIEMTSAQKVLEAKNKELKTENHLSLLAERTVGRMRLDMTGLETETLSVQEMLASVQASLYRNTEKLDKFKADMNWKQEELEKWSVQARANDQNVIALDDYTRGDEQKVRDLTRELETLTGRVAVKKRELDADVTETSARQVELDKLAEDFRNLHGERQDLIKQWQDSLVAIHKRDEDIAKSAARFADLKEQMKRRRDLVNEQAKRLQDLEQENVDMESRTEFLTRQMGEARDDIMIWSKRVSDLRDAVELLKQEVSAAASELVQRRSENANYVSETASKERTIERLKQDLVNIKQKLQDAKNKATSLEEAVEKKELFLKTEAIAIDKKEHFLSTLKEAEYRARDTVATLHTEEEHLHGEIAGLRRTIKNLGDKVTELDSLSVRQQEHLYTAEFQIQQMERKIAKSKGEVSDEEKVKLEAKVAELTKEAEDAKGTMRSLESEAKKVKQSLQNAVRRSESLTEQLTELRSRIDKLLLQTRSGEESLRKATREKEEAMVAHDLLKIEVRKLRDALSNKTEDVYGLENRAVQLELSIEARKKEISAHRLVQRAQHKLVEEERHKLALDLAERAQRVNALKAKYETLCARLRGSDGSSAADATEGQGQAYFVLQAAQKREELQREGDELDRNIKRAEKEMKALVHSLNYLNQRNDTLRIAFQRVEEGSDDATAVKALDNQANAAQDELFKRKRRLTALQQEVDANIRQITAAEERLAGLKAQHAQLEASAVRVEAERQQQVAQCEAAAAKLEQARQRHRRARRAPLTSPTPDELAFLAQGIRDSNASVLFTLGQLAKSYAQLKPSLQAHLSERNLKMPARPPSRVAGPSAGGTASGNNGGTASLLSIGPIHGTPSTGRAGAAAAAAAIPVSPMTIPAAAPQHGGSNGGGGSRPSSNSSSRNNPSSNRAGSAESSRRDGNGKPKNGPDLSVGGIGARR